MLKENAYFVISGENSLEHNLLIKPEFNYPIAVRDVEHIDIPGRGRSITVDNGNYKETQLIFPCYISMNREGFLKQSNHISRWLNKEQGWKELYFSDDPNYLYMVKNDELEGGNRNGTILGDISIPFKTESYKYLIDGRQNIDMHNNMVLVNPENEIAYPIIKIEGKGDITITINKRAYKFVGLNGYIIVNSDIENCTDSGGQANEKAHFTDYPFLDLGLNDISWKATGSITSVSITPNWRGLV